MGKTNPKARAGDRATQTSQDAGKCLIKLAPCKLCHLQWLLRQDPLGVTTHTVTGVRTSVLWVEKIVQGML